MPVKIVEQFGESTSFSQKYIRPPESKINPWYRLHTHVFGDNTKEFISNWFNERPGECACPKVAAIISANPISYDSEDSFKESCRRLHNAVNEKLSSTYSDRYYPQVSSEEYNYLWRDTAPRKSPRLVITVATGKSKQLLKYSRTSFKLYAEKHGADYIELTNEIPAKDLLRADDISESMLAPNTTWHFNKIRVGTMAAQYDQTLFLDADSIVTEKCRDLFQYPGIALVNDWSILCRNKVIEWVYPEYCDVIKSQNLTPLDSWERCLNTGVVVCTNVENPWVMPTKPLPMHHCAEQFWVDSNIKKFTPLPETCNWQWWRGSDFWRGLPSAEIIHFANCPYPSRLELIQWASSTYGIS